MILSGCGEACLTIQKEVELLLLTLKPEVQSWLSFAVKGVELIMAMLTPICGCSFVRPGLLIYSTAIARTWTLASAPASEPFWICLSLLCLGLEGARLLLRHPKQPPGSRRQVIVCSVY